MGAFRSSTSARRRHHRTSLHVCAVSLLSVVVALVVAAPAMGYVPGKRVWLRTSGTAAHERSFGAIAKGPNGVFYAAGYVYSSAAKKGDVLVVKYDAAGAAKWTKKWAGPGAADDRAVDVAADAKGNVYVLASSTSDSKSNMVVLKYTAAGVLKWAQVRSGIEAPGTIPIALGVDRSGNAVACANDWATPTMMGIVVAKYGAADGAKVWETGFYPYHYDPNAGNLWATDVALDAAGNAYAAGGSLYAGASQATVWKFESLNGNRAPGWVDTPAVGSEATAIAVRGQSVVITGWAAQAANAERLLVVAYDLGVHELHRIEYHNEANAQARDFGNDVAIGAHGEVYVTGYSHRDPPGGSGYSNGCETVRFSPDLDAIPWHRIYQPGGGAVSSTEGRRIVLDGTGSAYVVGDIETDATGEDLLVVKYGPGGTRKWVQRWDAGGRHDDGANDVTLGGTNAVYVVGFGTAKADVEKAVAMRINR